MAVYSTLGNITYHEIDHPEPWNSPHISGWADYNSDLATLQASGKQRGFMIIRIFFREFPTINGNFRLTFGFSNGFQIDTDMNIDFVSGSPGKTKLRVCVTTGTFTDGEQALIAIVRRALTQLIFDCHILEWDRTFLYGEGLPDVVQTTSHTNVSSGTLWDITGLTAPTGMINPCLMVFFFGEGAGGTPIGVTSMTWNQGVTNQSLANIPGSFIQNLAGATSLEGTAWFVVNPTIATGTLRIDFPTPSGVSSMGAIVVWADKVNQIPVFLSKTKAIVAPDPTSIGDLLSVPNENHRLLDMVVLSENTFDPNPSLLQKKLVDVLVAGSGCRAALGTSNPILLSQVGMWNWTLAVDKALYVMIGVPPLIT